MKQTRKKEMVQTLETHSLLLAERNIDLLQTP